MPTPYNYIPNVQHNFLLSFPLELCYDGFKSSIQEA